MKKLFDKSYEARIEIGGLERATYQPAYIKAIQAELERKISREVSQSCLKCPHATIERDSHETGFSSQILSIRAKCGATFRCIENTEPIRSLPVTERHTASGETHIIFDDLVPWGNKKPVEKSLIEREKELLEAVEYETSQKNYDSFGSW